MAGSGVRTKHSRVTEVIDMKDHHLVVTVEEAAAMLRISRGLAYELVRRGDLPALRPRRRLVVPRHRLLAMIGTEDTSQVS